MFQALLHLRRTDEAARTAANNVGRAPVLVGFAHRMAAAHRTDGRELEGLCRFRPLLENNFDDLRDDVAGALHDDGIADADVLARDLVLVVQRRVRDDNAADRNRLELCDRRQRASAANLNFNAAQHRRRLFGGELVRDGPARRARHESEPLLIIETVHLVDDAVDIVAE